MPSVYWNYQIGNGHEQELSLLEIGNMLTQET